MALIIRVRDLRTFVMHEFGLADPIYHRDLVIGRDPDVADLVLDDPEIQPHHAVFRAAHRHRGYCLTGAPDVHPEPYKPFYLGPFGLQRFSVSEHDLVPAEAPPALAARVTSRQVRSFPVRPSVDARIEAVAQRMFARLSAGGDRIRALDRATAAWCEAQLAAHLARLSRATPGPPLALGQVVYAASSVDAVDRWTAEWTAIQDGPYVPAHWAHLRRLSRWAGPHVGDHELWMLREALGRLPVGPRDVAMEQESPLLPQAVIAQLALWCRKDPVDSPIEPLIALAERGAVAFALPGAAMLVYAPWLDGPPPDPREAALRHALWTDRDDLATRVVYADLLEQRGDHVRAALLRRDPRASPRIVGPSLYPHAAPVLVPHWPGRAGHRRRDAAILTRTPSGPPPSGACLELGQAPHVRFPLFAQTIIHDLRGQVRIEDAALVPAPVQIRAYLTYDEGVFWLRGDGGRDAVLLNDETVGRVDQPMADGDELRLTAGGPPFLLRAG